MVIRCAWIVLALAFAMSSASAADLGAMPSGAGGDLSSAPCDCGGGTTITIVDNDPGVVTRHWWHDCECRYAPGARPPLKVLAPRFTQQYESLTDPWRR